MFEKHEAQTSLPRARRANNSTAMEVAVRTSRCQAATQSLQNRIPTALLCCVYALLEFVDHVALSATCRFHCAAALLPASGCHSIRLAWPSRSADIPAGIALRRPRHAHVDGLANFHQLLQTAAWLARSPHLVGLTLNLAKENECSPLNHLGQLAHLQHLVLVPFSSTTVATALHACRATLRSFCLAEAAHIKLADPLQILASVAVPRASTFETLLSACSALESLTFQTAWSLPPGNLAVIGAARLPALRSLALIESVTAGGDMGVLSSHSALTSLAIIRERTNPIEMPRWNWPRLPALRSLDLGSMRCDKLAPLLSRLYPTVVRLRLGCANPGALVSSTALASLMIVDHSCGYDFAGSANRAGLRTWSCVGWLTYAGALGRLFSKLPNLTGLGVQSDRAADMFGRHVAWTLPRVTSLSLRIPSSTSLQIVAPALQVLRAHNMSAPMALQILSESPALQRFECSGDKALCENTCRTIFEAAPRVAVFVRHWDALDLRARFCGDTFRLLDH